MGVHHYSVQVPYGVVDVDNDRVMAIHEKPEKYYLVNAGVYVINPDVLNMIPVETVFQMTDLINLLMESGKNVGTHLLEDDWIDVGKHHDLAIARGNITLNN